jgi:hypothetical protein
LLTLLGLGCAAEKKVRLSLRPLAIAFELAPENLDVRLNYANALKDNGDFHGALEVYTGDIRFSSDELLLLGAGICKLETHDFVGARNFLELAFKLDPDSKNIIFNDAVIIDLVSCDGVK